MYVVARARNAKVIFITFIKYKWHFSFIIREQRWDLLFKRIPQPQEQQITITLSKDFLKTSEDFLK